jgi:uncharacterized protein
MIDSHGRFLWYELTTTDARSACAFYRDLLGWGTQDASNPGQRYMLFTAGQSVVGGLMELSQEARSMGLRPGWLGYVGVDNVDAAADRIVELGGAVHVPPTNIPNISRFAVAVDPQMATFALLRWLQSEQEQPAALSTPGHVGWHELLAADREQAWTFYERLFGWRKADDDAQTANPYLLFSTAGETIGGICTKPSTAPVPFWLYYFNVGDIDVAVTRVRAGGGRIVNGPIEVPGSRWIVQCLDPQGAIFALAGRRSYDGIGYFERIPPRGAASHSRK